MIRALIIEDELLSAEKLIRQISQVASDFEIVDRIESVDEAVKWLSANQADPIFLDIHLADGSGFDIFNKTRVSSFIIFTTAYDQYAIQAFKLNSIDYLLKPISTKDLKTAIQKFRSYRSQREDKMDYSQLVKMLNNGTQSYQRRFMITSGDRILTIKTDDIAYFFAEGKYAFIMTNNARQHLISQTLEKLEGQLDPKVFHRVNRQYIVNIDSISKMFSYSKSRVKLNLEPPASGDVIVSVDRSKSFKDWLSGKIAD